MSYTWEKESLEKYGEEATAGLIKQQQTYEEKKKDNDCEHCGKGNEGSIIERKDGTPFIMHFGLWTRDRCGYCGKAEK
ncbi:hypothetical protein ACTFR8_22480 [Bacillus cereus group sp. MYBK15-3]|uniref:hypothetical protein n=1 Tax=Bacillus cereus group TaxID=86661 RepID=UPI001C8C6EC3|nr:hypothetical protein [Bacillus cereus]MBX9158368.1 hypothetical protein [Bacillus cereus]